MNVDSCYLPQPIIKYEAPIRNPGLPNSLQNPLAIGQPHAGFLSKQKPGLLQAFL